MSDLFSDVSEASQSVIPTTPTPEAPASTPEASAPVQPQASVVPQTPEASKPEASTPGAEASATPETPVAEASPETPAPEVPATPTLADRIASLGGDQFVESAVSLYESLAGAEFKGEDFLSSLYQQSPGRYSELIAEIVKQHSDDLSKYMFGVDAQTLTQALKAGSGEAPEQINAIAAHFHMTQDDFDLLPEESQKHLKESYDAAMTQQKAMVEQQQIQAQQQHQQNFDTWRVSCNTEIGKVLDTLGVKDSATRSDIEAMTYGALNSDPNTQKLFNDILQHLNNGEYGLANSLTPKLHTNLATIAAKKAAKEVELGKLRAENDDLKRQLGSGRRDVPVGASAAENRVPTNNPNQTFGNVFDINDIKSQLDQIKQGSGRRV